MIGRAELDRVLAAVQASGVGDQVDALLRPRGDGRPRQLSVDVFITGVILTLLDKRNAELTEVHATLTKHIARSAQIAIGTRYRRPGKPVSEPITIRQVRYLLEAIDRKLTTTATDDAETDAVEVASRGEALQRVLHLVVGSSLPDHLPPVMALALDATALESWGIGKRRPTTPDTEPGDPAASETADDDAPADAEPEADATVLEGCSFDRDARWGYRTKTYDNRSNRVFGYDMFAMVSVPAEGQASEELPKLIQRFSLRPAGLDVVAPALSLLDGLADDGHVITELLNDRAWSYKTADRWADQLRARHIEQIFDLHPFDRGVRDYEGIRMVDGTPHCVAMPDELIDIPRPATLSAGKLKKKATAAERVAHAQRVTDLATFADRIKERSNWAFRLHTNANAAGDERWECPAYSGKLICVHCPLSPFMPAGTTKVTDPPAAATRPKACRQQTVTIPSAALAKLRQKHYWGSPEWIESFSRRTHVEGFFGTLKSRSATAITRGWCRVAGLVKTSFLAACAAAATNIRLLRAWSAKTGDITSPLTAPLPESFGFEELTGPEDAPVAHAPPVA